MGISFLFAFAFSFFSQLLLRPPQITILPFYISLFSGWFSPPPPVQCYDPLSIILQALCPSDLIPWIYLSLPLYIHKGFDLGHTWMPICIPYILQFKSELCNKEFMIWATVSSWSCFYWLYRTSSSLMAKNIINLILILTILWCPIAESSVVLLEKVICYDQCALFQSH